MAPSKNKSFADLKKSFQGSIDYIKHELDLALKMDYADEMRFQSAITIANRLRMLLNDEGRNRSLLEQLHLKKKLLFDLSSVDLASNLIFSAKLLGVGVQADRFFWTPNEVSRMYNVVGSFEEWWNEIIIDDKGENSNQVSRRDVVLTLCDKEGGAHLDPDFDGAYYTIQFEKGWRLFVNGEERSSENNSFAESVFVIAGELLSAIDLYYTLSHYSDREASTDYNLFCIKYQGTHTKMKVHRFAFNPNRRINDAFRIAYDYYREAEYSLVGLKIKRFFNQRNILLYQFLCVDRKFEKPLHYLIKENGERYVFLGDEKGLFRLIREDGDIYKEEEGKPLDVLVEALKG